VAQVGGYDAVDHWVDEVGCKGETGKGCPEGASKSPADNATMAMVEEDGEESNGKDVGRAAKRNVGNVFGSGPARRVEVAVGAIHGDQDEEGRQEICSNTPDFPNAHAGPFKAYQACNNSYDVGGYPRPRFCVDKIRFK